MCRILAIKLDVYFFFFLALGVHTFSPAAPGEPGGPSFPAGPWKYRKTHAECREIKLW